MYNLTVSCLCCWSTGLTKRKTTHAMYYKSRDVCWWSTETLVSILLHLNVDQWLTRIITQIVPLNSCDLFLVILVTNYYGISRFCCMRDFEENLIKIHLIRLSPKPWVKHSLEFSFFFPSLLCQLVDWKTRWQLIQLTNINTSCVRVKMHLYDHIITL